MRPKYLNHDRPGTGIIVAAWLILLSLLIGIVRSL